MKHKKISEDPLVIEVDVTMLREFETCASKVEGSMDGVNYMEINSFGLRNLDTVNTDLLKTLRLTYKQ